MTLNNTVAVSWCMECTLVVLFVVKSNSIYQSTFSLWLMFLNGIRCIFGLMGIFRGGSISQRVFYRDQYGASSF